MAEQRSISSYDPVARDKRYIRLNTGLVRQLLRLKAKEQPIGQVLDLACGTGLLTRLFLQMTKILGEGVRVVCLDPDREALRAACCELAQAPASFIVARAEALPLASEAFDLVLFGNAIHLIKDKARAVREIHRVLRPQGYLALNTTFYTGAYPEDTKSFYLRWVKKAMALLREQAPRRERGTRAIAMDWLSPEQYRALFEGAGFRILYLGERMGELAQKTARAIAGYRDFVQGALRVTEEELAAASRALQKAVRPAFREEGRKRVPRRWLEIIAQKL